MSFYDIEAKIANAHLRETVFGSIIIASYVTKTMSTLANKYAANLLLPDVNINCKGKFGYRFKGDYSE